MSTPDGPGQHFHIVQHVMGPPIYVDFVPRYRLSEVRAAQSRSERAKPSGTIGEDETMQVLTLRWNEPLAVEVGGRWSAL
jgi:hypothetical protein